MGKLKNLNDDSWLPSYKNKLKQCIMKHNNLNDDEDDNAMIRFKFYGNLPLGKKSQLFCISRNNVSESQANVAKII